MDTVKALNFINKKKVIVEAKTIAWIVTNGHVPRFKVMRLIGWVPGDFYMQTRHWRLYELDGYVGEYDY
jgi:hypothetical protein